MMKYKNTNKIVYIDPSYHKQVAHEAKRTHRTIQAMLEIIVEKYFKNL